MTSELATPSLFFMNSIEKQIESFYLDFRIAMGEFTESELKKIEGNNLFQVFKQKETTEETLAKMKNAKNN